MAIDKSKTDLIKAKYEELTGTLSDPAVASRPDEYTKYSKELAALKMQLKEQYTAYAASSEKIHQLIDIAMLAAGQLKGEALAKFVNRSIELL